MDQLRASFEQLGFENTQTYIQSGNVVFKSAKTSPATLCKKIEAKIVSDFGHSVSVIVRTADEMQQVITGSPFLKQKGIDPEKLHVMFLSQEPSANPVRRIGALTKGLEQICCVSQELCRYYPTEWQKTS